MQQKCRVCKSENLTFLLTSENIHGRKIVDEKDKFKINKCGGCGSLSLQDIKIDARYYRKYYPEDYYSFSSSNESGILNRLLIVFENFCARVRLKFILGNIKKSDKEKLNMLDVGCGDGGFLKLMPEELFNKYGLEINEDASRSCNNSGLKVFNSSVESFDPKDLKFDVVTMWHVLEHVDDPQVVLKKIYSLLSKDGIFVFSVPNAGSMGFKLGNKLWFHLDSPRHLYIPSNKP